MTQTHYRVPIQYCSKSSHDPDGYLDVGDKGMNFEIGDILQMLVPDPDFQREDASS